MNWPIYPSRPYAMCALACVLAGGCAGLPRIDPTGNRVFIWPKDQPQVATLTAPSSSVVAPPVVTDPFFPQPPVVAAAATPAVATVSPTATTATVALAQTPQDRVTVTPERILAPVGSEVVLKAAVCTAEGYTLADQRVEWMLGRNGVGQFVEVSGKGWFHPPLLPWNKPKKVDNYLAEGWTANGPLCVTRGTADPADDVNINRGDAWISVTSPNEGTSYVTAYMPGVESWEQRRNSATIYWVDVQWTFPPATVAGGGRSATLTTQITRQSNGTPIEGWIVRYELADGGNLSAGAGGQVVEVRTDAQGRATVEATPTAAGAATTPVNIQLIRPAGFGGGDAPRLVVGTGVSMIQWGGTTPYFSPGTTTPGTVPGTAAPAPDATPIPTIPQGSIGSPPPVSGWTPPPTGGPATGGPVPIPSTAPARPQLELTLSGDQQAVAGGKARLEMLVRNIGTAPATNVVVTDRLDPGLMDDRNPDSRTIDFTGIPTLQPGDYRRLPVLFSVMQAGRLCHNVSVASSEGATATGQLCVVASPPQVQKVGRVAVRKEGPRYGVVGDAALFRITVENTGELPLVDVRVLDEYPTQFFQVRPPANMQVVSGNLEFRIPRLDIGARQSFEVETTCLQPAPTVIPKPKVRVIALTDPQTSQIETAADVDLEIRPRQTGDTSAAIGAPGVGGMQSGATPLNVGMTFTPRQARAGSRATVQVTVVNSSTTADEQVELVVGLPAQLTPDVLATQAPPNVRATLETGQLRFSPVASLRPTERVIFVIEMTVKEPTGVVDVTATARSRNLPTGMVWRTPLEIVR